MDDQRLKTAVITDVTTEIGRDAAMLLAENGYRLMLCVPKGKNVRPEDRFQLEDRFRSKDRFGEMSCICQTEEVDFADEAEVLRLFQSLTSVRVLFYNNLPEILCRPVSQISHEEFGCLVEEDITSVVTTAKVFGSLMKNGSLIFLGSVHSDKPSAAAPLNSMYMGALKNMVREGAVSFGTGGNRCNLIEVGAMGGEDRLYQNEISHFYVGYSFKIPNGHIPVSRDISQIVCFLAEDAAAVNGEAIRADSGLVLEYLDKLANARAYERMSDEGCGG